MINDFLRDPLTDKLFRKYVDDPKARQIFDTTVRLVEIAMIAVPVVIVALAAFFRYTNIGIAVRGSAENADRAFLLGVPVKRIETVVWVIATVLAYVSVFLRAGVVGLPIGQLLGPAILVRALAASVMGRMERLPTIFGASVLLGVLEAAIIFHMRTGYSEPERFSSFGVARATTEETPSNKNRGRSRKA